MSNSHHWRIQNFPELHQSQRWQRKTIILTIFPKNCMKSKNIEPGGDTHTNSAPPP